MLNWMTYDAEAQKEGQEARPEGRKSAAEFLG
jgi:hypothetical protein